jgi:hypothetical protein
MSVTPACGNAVECLVNGDNIKGHVIFPADSPGEAGKTVLVQFSKDSFATVASDTRVSNTQGLVAVPYSYCAETEKTFSVRAFQDSNGDGMWEAGEAAGRDDGTSDGNSTYKTYSFPKPQPSANPPVGWKIENDVNIWMDSTSAQ